VLCCGKHFPGHGRTLGDSHEVLPRAKASRAALAKTELVPFVAAIRAGIPALMSAHVVYPTFDPRNPGTLSSAICTTLLRRRLGVEGVLFTDDLGMHAVAGRATPEDLAPAAFGAGCDMLLVCQTADAARRAIDGLVRSVDRGVVPTARVVEAIGRIHALRRK